VVKVHFCLSFCRVIEQNDAALGVLAKPNCRGLPPPRPRFALLRLDWLDIGDGIAAVKAKCLIMVQI
jgi:hypothetical protein